MIRMGAQLVKQIAFSESGLRPGVLFRSAVLDQVSSKMQFRLLSPAAAQCADTALVQQRHTSVTTLLQQFRSNTLVQCKGITRAGRCCAITNQTDFRDGAGRLVAEPVRRGSSVCLFHLDLFVLC